MPNIFSQRRGFHRNKAIQSAPLKNHQMPPIHFVTPKTMAKRFTRAKPISPKSSKPSARWAASIVEKGKALICHPELATDTKYQKPPERAA